MTPEEHIKQLERQVKYLAAIVVRLQYHVDFSTGGLMGFNVADKKWHSHKPLIQAVQKQLELEADLKILYKLLGVQP
jgi:hypothetical protein